MALQNTIFEEKSTNRNDYKVPILTKQTRQHEWTKKPLEKEKIYKHKPYQPKDINTMQPWKDINQIPFNAFWEIKPIIRTNPQFTFKLKDKVETTVDSEILKNRRRLYMSPAVCMDDIEDKDLRKLLCKNMYTSTQQKAAEDLNIQLTEREVPNTTFEKLVNPMQESFTIYKELTDELRKNGKYWESKQYTTLVDPTAKYWADFYELCVKNNRIPAGRDPFEKAMTEDRRKEIRDLIEKDELRREYDKRKQGYLGYYPRYMVGPLRKKNVPPEK